MEAEEERHSLPSSEPRARRTPDAPRQRSPIQTWTRTPGVSLSVHSFIPTSSEALQGWGFYREQT